MSNEVIATEKTVMDDLAYDMQCEIPVRTLQVIELKTLSTLLKTEILMLDTARCLKFI